MTPEQYGRVKTIFSEAVEVAAGERVVWLDRHPEDDHEVLREVCEMLAEHDAPHSFAASDLDGGGAKVLAAHLTDGAEPTLPSPVPEQIGRYRIIRGVGCGGMGIVYEAEQDSPKRRVALKVMHPSFAPLQRLARFKREAEVLGQLQHPGIAHIYEAGVDTSVPGGQPYLAMEFIEGRPLRAHADEQKLSKLDRLELLARVCDAVQHAHQKGIIHRDLKPSNILVAHTDAMHSLIGDPLYARSSGTNAALDGIGQPKVLDFGIARITDYDINPVTMQTSAGQLLGTLAYMSPEQVAGDSVKLDTRSDVYALGVVLYELLTGWLPLDITNTSVPEVARIIRDDDPTRLSSIDASLRGDIDTITAKAMEKNPDRRYSSAAELAADLRRCVRNEPILARPTSVLYQLKQFSRRNKTLVGVAVAAVISLVLGLVGMTWFALQEADARTASDRATYRASLAAASAALGKNDIGAAKRHLGEAPENLRDWVWQYLDSGLDQSLMHASLVAGPRSPSRSYIERGRARTWFSDGGRFVHVVRHLNGKSGTLLVETRKSDSLERTSSWSMDHVLWFAPNGDGTGLVIATTEDGAKVFDVAGARAGASVDQPFSAGKRRVFVKSRLPLEELRSQQRPTIPITLPGRRVAIAFSPGGRRMLAISGIHSVIYSVDGPIEGEAFADHPEGISDAAFGPNGRYLAIGGFNRRLSLFDLEEEQRQVWQRDDAQSDAILAVAFSPDGVTLATGGQDCVLRLWDARTGESLGEMVGHSDPILAISFSDSGREIATCTATHVKTWDIEAVQDLHVMRGHSSFVDRVAVSPDGSTLVSAGIDIRIWDVASGMFIGAWRKKGGSRIRGLSFSRDGKRLAIVRQQWNVKQPQQPIVFDMRTGRVERVFDDGTDAHNRTTHMVYDATGRFLVRGRLHQSEILDAKTYEPVRSPLRGTNNLCLDHRGRRLALARSPERTLTILDAASTEPIREWSVPSDFHCNLCLIDDGHAVAFDGRDYAIAVLDVDSGRERGLLRGHTRKVRCLAEIPGQSLLVSGANDRTIRLWNLETMEEIIVLRGHTDGVEDLAVTPDGTTIFSASGDYTVRRWDKKPLSAQLIARRDYRRAAERLTPTIESHIRELNDFSAVADRVESDPALSARERRIAMQLVLKAALSRAKHNKDQPEPMGVAIDRGMTRVARVSPAAMGPNSR